MHVICPRGAICKTFSYNNFSTSRVYKNSAVKIKCRSSVFLLYESVFWVFHILYLQYSANCYSKLVALFGSLSLLVTERFLIRFSLTDKNVLCFFQFPPNFLFEKANHKKGEMNFHGSRRRGEDGVAMVIDFLLSNARLVLGVGGAALLGIATLAVKRVSVCFCFKLLVPQQCIFPRHSAVYIYGNVCVSCL